MLSGVFLPLVKSLLLSSQQNRRSRLDLTSKRDRAAKISFARQMEILCSRPLVDGGHAPVVLLARIFCDAQLTSNKRRSCQSEQVRPNGGRMID